ncbi:MAG: hypothetical protein K0U86_11735 [Planctomycetes bacterium]|nr:hypothetical protein [Planctomycetota bacterium]MCH9725554.1 hypothetical protein [Planctomycetota bacterium]MCH9777608.1 hypothetical protein [Planctomycetota bacterium]MCH9790803.1 hypothetical protein [Planctomycetota bacterium]
MQHSYGNYNHAENEADISITRSGLVADNGFVYGYTETWAIKGILHGDTDELLVTAMADLHAAYSIQNQDLVWEKNGTTMHELISANTLSGTRVTTLPQFSKDGQGELTTFRSYDIVVSADVAFAGLYLDQTQTIDLTKLTLLKYEESINYTGTGGRRFGFLPTLEGKYQKQQLTEKSLVSVTQSGLSVGLGARPLPNDPLWPDDEHLEKRQIRYPPARKRGGFEIEYPIHWSYTFERNDQFPTPTT